MESVSQQVATADVAAKRAVAGDAKAELIIGLGRAFHAAGLPCDQLEALMHGAATALGRELQVAVLPTSFTAAIGPSDAQRLVLLRLQPGSIHLRRLARLNALFDRVLTQRVTTEDALDELRRIAATPGRPPAGLTVPAFVALSSGSAILLGGGPHECAVAAFIGLLTGGLSLAGRSHPTVDRLFEVFTAFIATLVIGEYRERIGPLAVYVPLVAGVTQALPGLQLTTALHELAYRNIVAGTSRLGRVLTTLLSLGCGIALGIAVTGPGALRFTRILRPSLHGPDVVLAILCLACGIAVLMNARLRDLPFVLASCGTAEIAYRVFALLPNGQVATFGASLCVGILTSLGARLGRIPQALLLVPGLVVLVPGALSYESLIYVLQSDAVDAGTLTLNAVIAAVQIVTGLLFAQLLFSPIRRRLPA